METGNTKGTLFRKEALEGQKHRLHGAVLVLPSIKLSIIAMVLTIWVVALLIWLFQSEYARKETVQGWLEPEDGVIRIFAESASGKIKRILVAEGDYVEKDQALIVVNGDRALQDGSSLEEQLLKEYEKQKSSLTQQMTRNSQIYFHRIQDAKNQINILEQESAQLQQQLNLLKQRHEMVQERLASSQQVRRRGHISKYDYSLVVAEELSLQSDIAGITRQLLNQQNTLQRLHSELRIYPEEEKNTIAQLQSQLSSVAQKIAQLHGQRAHVIKATQSGFVSNIQVNIGQYTQTNLPLLSIVPSDSSLQARLLVPVRAAGFVQAGQSIDMRYDAFPYQKFGLHKGMVLDISSAAILPNEIKQLAVNIQEPVFIVKASLDKNWVQAFGQKLALKPGMTLSADIQLAERSLMEWLLEPLYSIKGRL